MGLRNGVGGEGWEGIDIKEGIPNSKQTVVLPTVSPYLYLLNTELVSYSIYSTQIAFQHTQIYFNRKNIKRRALVQINAFCKVLTHHTRVSNFFQ